MGRWNWWQLRYEELVVAKLWDVLSAHRIANSVIIVCGRLKISQQCLVKHSRISPSTFTGRWTAHLALCVCRHIWWSRVKIFVSFFPPLSLRVAVIERCPLQQHLPGYTEGSHSLDVGLWNTVIQCKSLSVLLASTIIHLNLLCSLPNVFKASVIAKTWLKRMRLKWKFGGQ